MNWLWVLAVLALAGYPAMAGKQAPPRRGGYPSGGKRASELRQPPRGPAPGAPPTERVPKK